MCRTAFLLFSLVLYSPAASASVVTIDFEGLADLDPITNQFPGLVFSNAASIISGAAGGSSNEAEFPPRSGLTVAFNTGSPLEILFSPSVVDVTAYLTYNVLVTMTAFGALNQVVGTATSAYSNNLLVSGEMGSVPNEPLTVAFAGGVSRIELSTLGTFTLDDLTYTTASTAVPEVSSVSMLAMAALAGLLLRRVSAA